MSSTPFMQLYVGDYLSDTLDLTTEQHGAYLLLLMTMWKAGGKLTNCPKKLARICRVSSRRWHTVWPEISHFFEDDGESIINERLQSEYQKAVSIREKRVAAGAAGGAAKSLKTNDQGLANAKAEPKHSHKSQSEPYRRDTNVSLPMSAPMDHDLAFDEYNISAKENGWGIAMKKTKPRVSAIKARLKDCDGIEGWRMALSKSKESDFLCGRKGGDFNLTIDFLCQESSFTKLMEGKYDNRDSNNNTGATNNGRGMARPTAAEQITNLAIRRAEARKAGIDDYL